MAPIPSAAVKVAVSLAALGIIAVRIYRGKRPLQWYGIVAPPLYPTLGFVALMIAYYLGTDALTHWRGPWDFTPWKQAPILASALRIFAVCLIGPAVEELLFRGALFSWLRDRVSIGLTIGLTAVSWSVLHYSYAWWVIAIIAGAGVLLGIARWKTGSVFAPIAMHIAYNLYAIW